MIETRSTQILRANSLEEMDKCVSDWISEFESILDTETQVDGSYIHPSVQAICYLIQKFYTMEFNNNKENVKKIAFTSTPRRTGSSTSSFTPNRFNNKSKGSLLLSELKQVEKPIQWQAPSSVPGLMSRSMSNLEISADLSTLNRSVSLSNDNGIFYV